MRKIIREMYPILCSIGGSPYAAGICPNDHVVTVSFLESQACDPPHARVPSRGGVPIGGTKVYPTVGKHCSFGSRFIDVCVPLLEFTQTFLYVRKESVFIYQPKGIIFPTFIRFVPGTTIFAPMFKIIIGFINYFLDGIGPGIDHLSILLGIS